MANAWSAARGTQNGPTGGKPVEPPSHVKVTDRKGTGGGTGKSGERKQDQPQGNGSQENAQNPSSGQQPGQNQAQQPGSAPSAGLPDMSGLAALNGLNNDDPNSSGSVAPNTPPNSRKLA